ncbi:hypothetical protein BMW23_0710 [Bodo saltans virus]|uniref:DUF4326 domain-containing protein n=1 Tax=Bodo saltans virus TaxID=2024608 RepID=A0A2H4UV76_9VIRU|nr:hypothetical protein QJ851_gp0693 [Bodo saltans virus]ATZ80756.1 hypothetical protein BMW23_0710 [Bodo saltans virus]
MICNVKVENIRPTYNNLKEWTQDTNNVYIGRKGIVFIDSVRFPKEDSIWHNPYKITNTNTRDEVLEKYEKYITEKIKNENLHEQLKKLKGKNLGCWCKPEKCHGDILLKIIEKVNE